MSKSIYLNVETQTENREVLAVCHINEKMIALETSFIANKMFSLNRKLFDKINRTTKMTGGALYRQEVTRPKENINRVSVLVLDAKEHNEFQICNLFFENNILKKQRRAITRRGTKFDFDPTTVSDANTGGPFNEKRLSPDDIIDSTVILTVEEIKLFQDKGVKTILIKDNLFKKQSLIEVGYRIELTVENDFKKYIDYVLGHAEASLNFLTTYYNSLGLPTNYDSLKKEFKEDYTNAVMQQLGLATGIGNADLTGNKIKNSEFGKVGVSYYNLSLLLTDNAKKSVYSKILKSILPTNKTSPETIHEFIKDFTSLINDVKYQYLKNNKQTKKDSNYSRASETRENVNQISATSVEKIAIEQEKLGYSVFSEVQSGLNKFSRGAYSQRIVAEEIKHYPSLRPDDDTKFLKTKERSEFSRKTNASAFLTPTKLIMGQETITTSRGMKNIPINQIRKFRLAKSARFSQQKSSRFPQSISKAKIDLDSISSFNVTISTPKPALLERPFIVDIDPLKESRFYVGKDSSFATNNPLVLLKQFKRVLTKDEQRTLEIASDIVPRRFLRNDKAIKSIKEIQFSNPKSVVRKLASAGELDLASIPPQVKFMMTKKFNPNPDSDPLKNREARQIVEETQKNIFVVRALVDFNLNDLGFLDVYNPIYQNLDSSVMGSGRPILGKVIDYEVPELGIVKDNFSATIYSNLVYIGDK